MIDKIKYCKLQYSNVNNIIDTYLMLNIKQFNLK